MLSPMPLPGQMRLWTMQAIAHGADYVSYFRWRTASYGTEMYWHGILDYDSRDNRRLKELGEIHQDTKRLNGLAGSRYQARVLLMTDWLNEWDGERDKWYGPMSYQSSRAIFAAAQHTHTLSLRITQRHNPAWAWLRIGHIDLCTPFARP